MTCSRCRREMYYEDFLSLVLDQPKEIQASLRGALGGQIRDRVQLDRNPYRPKRLPCEACRTLKPELTNMSFEDLRDGLRGLADQDKASILGSIGNRLRKTRGAGPGRPRNKRRKTCPCGKDTLKRAKARYFHCCRQNLPPEQLAEMLAKGMIKRIKTSSRIVKP